MEAFLSSDAWAHGYSRDQARVLPHPTYGVVAPSGVATLVARCRAVSLGLPDDVVFTHLTAARLYGWWLPRIDDEPLIACTDGDAPHHDRRGVYVRRCDIPAEHRGELDGVPVASPEWTINELAEDLAFIDLVVVIDSAIQKGHTTTERVRDSLVRGRRGVRALRRALLYVDGRSESPWETLLRLLHELCGIPVDVQVERRDERSGVVLWRLDLLIRGTSRAPEYDGADHTRPDVRHRDLQPDKTLVRDGIERYAYVAVDLMQHPARVVRDAEEALGRPHDPARLKAWWPEIETSSFTPAGYGRLLRRLRRFRRPVPPRRLTP